MQLLAVAGVGASAFAILIVLRRLMRERGLGWNGAITVLLCFAPTLTIFLAAVTGARTVVGDGLGGLTFISSENWAISNTTKLILLALAAGVAVVGRLRNPAVLYIAAAGLAAMFGTGFAGYPIVETRTAIMVAILIAYAFIAGGVRIDLAVVVFAVTLVAASFMLWLINPALATLECRAYKCGPLGFLVVGVLNNENQIAIPIALSVVFVVRAFAGWQRAYLALLLLGFVYITGSRTSAAAMAVYLAATLLCLNLRNVRVANLLASAAALVSLAMAFWVPITNKDSGFLTGRGRLWDAAIELWASSPLVGVGVYPWRDLVANGIVPTNAGATPSNVWVDALMVSGVLGVTLVVVGLLVAYVRSDARGRLHLALAGILVGVIGLAESSLVFADLSSPIAFFLPALLVGASSSCKPAGAEQLRSEPDVRRRARSAKRDSTQLRGVGSLRD